MKDVYAWCYRPVREFKDRFNIDVSIYSNWSLYLRTPVDACFTRTYFWTEM